VRETALKPPIYSKKVLLQEKEKKETASNETKNTHLSCTWMMEAESKKERMIS
jgi:hypothetical protein